ncbi:hypothetical protein VP01_1604g3 [Puccinia sorghi]|uniref:Uncharacterized protein n=1 Tax=Puccinia sorghi TaxID=27349 RepID=A0A0L6VHU5_9BASI|nr:hypothetical protein VP01_1604g3 [Puccinia sorghi]
MSGNHTNFISDCYVKLPDILIAEHIYLFQKWIASQSTAFKTEYLPVGYEEGNHEQTLLRNLVSSLSFHHKFVPKLGDLYLVIEWRLRTRDSVQSMETIQQQWTSHLKIREMPARSGMSSMIILRYSERGDWFRSKRHDRQLFNGRAMIEDIDRQDICLPTKDEVEELRVSMATQGKAAVNQLLNDETAAS